MGQPCGMASQLIPMDEIRVNAWSHIERPPGTMQPVDCPQGVELTHIRTGLKVAVDSERAQYRNMEKARRMMLHLVWLSDICDHQNAPHEPRGANDQQP